jgi:hypothetical protein
MAHFAEVEEGIVTRVIVADSQQWCETNLGGTWVQTSYNTSGGVNNREGGEALRKNYAGIGYHYDGIGFYPPQPYPSWIKDEETYLWGAPTPMPEDGKLYEWNEEDLEWVEIPVSE